MQTYLLITAVIGVYVALTVFVFGMGWRIYQWVSTPRSPVKLGLFPKPATRVGRYAKMLKDTLIAPQSAAIEPRMWVFAFMFHVAALIGFLGHLRLVGEYPLLAEMLGVEKLDTVSGWVGSTVGILMLISVIYWIGRRTFGPFKQLSVPEDYLLLALLLGIIVMGDHMRFVDRVPTETFRAWFQSLLAFRPAIPAGIADSDAGWSLATHMLLVDALLIYFPFSKLVHIIGSFATNLARSE